MTYYYSKSLTLSNESIDNSVPSLLLCESSIRFINTFSRSSYYPHYTSLQPGNSSFVFSILLKRHWRPFFIKVLQVSIIMCIMLRNYGMISSKIAATVSSSRVSFLYTDWLWVSLGGFSGLPCQWILSEPPIEHEQMKYWHGIDPQPWPQQKNYQ